MFDGEILSISNNAGEKVNLVVWVDMFLNKKRKGLVFSSDDKKAINDLNSFLLKIPREQLLEKRKKLPKSKYSNDEYSRAHQKLQNKVVNQKLPHLKRLNVTRK